MITRCLSKWGSVTIPDAVAARAATRYKIDGECFVSTYSVMSTGYAQVGWQVTKGKHNMVLAHRAAWVYHHGQIPVGMTVDHLCKNKRCVKVDHLRLLENLENARRTSGRDWPVGTCIRGHPNDLWVPKKGSRQGFCRECRREWQRTYRARKNGAKAVSTP